MIARIKRLVREWLDDWHRERLIRSCERIVSDTNNSREERRLAFAMMAEQIRARSPRKIRRLEIAKFGRSFLR